MRRHPCDVRLPCGLTARAKAHAREAGRDLKDVVGDALRLYLSGRDGVMDRPPVELAAAALALGEIMRRPEILAGLDANGITREQITLARDVLAGEFPDIVEIYRKHLMELSK